MFFVEFSLQNNKAIQISRHDITVGQNPRDLDSLHGLCDIRQLIIMFLTSSSTKLT
jgi:hypothetical protein